MTALFVVIFMEQWKEADSHIPAIAGTGITLVALLLLGPSAFLMPALLIIVMILLIGRKKIVKVKDADNSRVDNCKEDMI